MDAQRLLTYLEECRQLALEEIRSLLPEHGRTDQALYTLMLDYPLREAKGLRPALCIAACRALGGKLESALPSAAVIELYHNAFLIHDDIEDQSLMRRGKPTLHLSHGVPVAVNVGDAMLALTLQPLLANIERIGLGPALRILELVSRMTRETVEGQALELDWIRRATWDLADEDYVLMVEKKTGWYSFIAPVVAGAIAAGASPEQLEALTAFARSLSIAFQIQDDVLNLQGDVGEYGKEHGGDLWEGKRTLILLHLMRTATPDERREAERILSLRRPVPMPDSEETEGEFRARRLRELTASGDLSARGAMEIGRLWGGMQQEKTQADVRRLFAMIDAHRSLAYATQVAREWAADARQRLEGCFSWLPDSNHRQLLAALVEYVLVRAR